MGRNYLKGRDGDAGYNFSLLLRWFEWLLRAFHLALIRPLPIPSRA